MLCIAHLDPLVDDVFELVRLEFGWLSDVCLAATLVFTQVDQLEIEWKVTSRLFITVQILHLFFGGIVNLDEY
jgi:hypothetical protein